MKKELDKMYSFKLQEILRLPRRLDSRTSIDPKKKQNKRLPEGSVENLNLSSKDRKWPYENISKFFENLKHPVNRFKKEFHQNSLRGKVHPFGE